MLDMEKRLIAGSGKVLAGVGNHFSATHEQDLALRAVDEDIFQNKASFFRDPAELYRRAVKALTIDAEFAPAPGVSGRNHIGNIRFWIPCLFRLHIPKCRTRELRR